MLLSGPVNIVYNILIIDDNLQNVLILENILSPLGNIFFAESGSNALALVDKIKPDVILLDIEMPDMDGWEVCRSLKANSLYSDIPIIFITGHTEPEFERLALESGGVDFITKPFNAPICCLRVHTQLKLRQQNRLMVKAKEELQQLVNQVPMLVTYWDNQGHNLFSNDYSGLWFESLNSNIKGKHISTIFPDELSNAILKHHRHISSDALKYVVTVPQKGMMSFYEVFQSEMKSSAGVDGYLVTVVDVSEVKHAKQALYSEKERLRVTLNSIGDAVIATDIKGLITFMNPIAERMTGWRLKEALHQKIENVMHLKDSDTQQTLLNPLYIALREQRIVAMALNSQLTSLGGHVFAVEDSAAPIRNENGEVIGAIMVFHDVGEAMAMAIKMSHLANHDQLTDLPNRILLQDRLSVACSTAKSYGTKAAALLVDIDHFKYLNDSLGHRYGDELICLMAKRIRTLIPASYTLARLGGDEFVILMSDTNSVDACSQLASTLVEAMHEPFILDNQKFNVSVSIGISVFPNDAADAEELMRHADVAMYRAKQEGRNRFCFFSHDLENAMMERHHLETCLRKALINNQLFVHYQPKFDLQTNAIVGAEALARLVNDEGVCISPTEFIPLAEESGLIILLGKQVLNKACAEAKRWLDMGHAIPISVNVAAAQFTDSSLPCVIKDALLSHGLPAHLLELEITETALMVDAAEMQNRLSELTSLGIKISIDDFGTGYSSLAYLKKFNVDVMKIDMSFIKDMLNNKHDYEIVKTIISLGKSMGLVLIAEGVETEAQRYALIELGCFMGQGYLFSRPLMTIDFETLLLQNQLLEV
ncbi:EAL domain-containing protein [Shewanella livingstonensis]|uniref:EAL domain-containing protein n=1 Tax=Shewanella livingstonensis TaxID=150120 RepID=A0A3G8M1A1_9GAMM|nr:EAL domain-containing protein [Shewanella livingstonensis]AZG74698.1 EAL domain-containing protein [Shewanella livingstonensis]